MRILVVEDDVLIAVSIRQLLQEAGYAVDVEHDAISGLRTFDIEPRDLVVLDLRLPGMAGVGSRCAVRSVNGRPTSRS